MYNQKQKEKYLAYCVTTNKHQEQSVANVRAKFEASEAFETALNKDLCNFSLKEIIDYYRSLKTPSMDYLIVTNNTIRNYTYWAIENGKSKTGANYYKAFDTNMIDMCVSKRDCLDRETVLKACNSLANPGDAFIILALFEGICGKNYEEIFWADESQLDENGVFHTYVTDSNGNRIDGRSLKISDELATLLHKACSEYTYTPVTETDRTYDFDGSDHKAIKKMYNMRHNAEDVTPQLMLQRIRTRFDRSKGHVPELDGQSTRKIREAGKVDMIRKLMAAEGSKDVKAVMLKYKEEIAARYGETPSIKRWLLIYGDELK